MTATIGIDLRMAHHSGIGTYQRNLASELIKLENFKKQKPLFFGHSPDEAVASAIVFPESIYSVREQIQYPSHLRKCQLWHAPHYNIPLCKGKTKLVTTIHDIIHWLFRKELLSPLKQFYAGYMLSQATKKSDHIIAVSQTTKDDLVEHFRADPNKISVVYEGVAERFREEDSSIENKSELNEKWGISGDYFLYVGNLKPHKNVHWLVDVFSQHYQAGKTKHKLVIVGTKDKRYDRDYAILNRIEDLPGVVYLNSIEDSELKLLYNHAISLIHPSLYEGFGLTPLEAMACGTPVIACRAGSVPEVLGEAAYLIVPQNRTMLFDAMDRLATDSQLRQQFVEKGKKQVEKYSWKKAAEETLAVYEKVLGQ